MIKIIILTLRIILTIMLFAIGTCMLSLGICYQLPSLFFAILAIIIGIILLTLSFLYGFVIYHNNKASIDEFFLNEE